MREARRQVLAKALASSGELRTEASDKRRHRLLARLGVTAPRNAVISTWRDSFVPLLGLVVGEDPTRYHAAFTFTENLGHHRTSR